MYKLTIQDTMEGILDVHGEVTVNDPTAKAEWDQFVEQFPVVTNHATGRGEVIISAFPRENPMPQQYGAGFSGKRWEMEIREGKLPPPEFKGWKYWPAKGR
jgi:hypothetical protein